MHYECQSRNHKSSQTALPGFNRVRCRWHGQFELKDYWWPAQSEIRFEDGRPIGLGRLWTNGYWAAAVSRKECLWQWIASEVVLWCPWLSNSATLGLLLKLNPGVQAHQALFSLSTEQLVSRCPRISAGTYSVSGKTWVIKKSIEAQTIFNCWLESLP